jgi:Domain of unknown function (DUF1844)
MPDKPPLFTVTDRRKFTTEGNLREGRPAEPAPTPAATENFATPETASTTDGPGLHLVGTEGRVDDSADKEQDNPAIQSRNSGASTQNATTVGQSANDPNLSDRGPSDGGLYDAGPLVDADDAQQPDDGLGPLPTAAETAEQHEAYRRSSNLIDTMVQQANPGAPPSIKMDFEQLVQSIYMAAIVAMGAGGEPGEKPRIDILGARQSIDMLAVLGEKTTGNLDPQEQRLLQSALYNLRMMFLEITNALAAQAQRGPQAGSPRGPQGTGPQGMGPRRPGPGK